MKDKHLALVLFVVLLNTLGKTWSNAPKYYKNLLYVSSWNSFYYYLCKRHLVYELIPNRLNWKLLRALHIFVVTPLLILYFLSKMPELLFKKIWYFIKWEFWSVLAEVALHKQGMVRFKYGWNFFWSGVVYLKMYLYSYLYSKRPILTWVLSIFSLIFFVKIFNIPIEKRLLKGPITFFATKKYPRRMPFKKFFS